MVWNGDRLGARRCAMLLCMARLVGSGVESDDGGVGTGRGLVGWGVI